MAHLDMMGLVATALQKAGLPDMQFSYYKLQ